MTKMTPQQIESKGSLREGCYVEYIDKSTNRIVKGKIIASLNGALNGTDKGQHIFNVDGKLVKGHDIYDRLLVHIPGERKTKR
ncbi:MAG: hypothetical protein KAT14_07840 [Candidatus Marinimicrobia bacterium]|nr:hypothetical protein [Candidatus Neomarinimicrobiota bacterium]